MGRSQRKSQIQIQAFHVSAKSRGSQISPMHLTQLWPPGTGAEQGQRVQLLLQPPCALLQESLLMAEPQQEGTALTAHNLLHPLPEVLQTQIFTFSRHKGWTHTSQGAAVLGCIKSAHHSWAGEHSSLSSDTAAPAHSCFLCFLSSFHATEQMLPRSNQNAHLD